MRASELYVRRVLPVLSITAAFVFACAPPARAQVDRWGFWENGVSESWWLSPKDFTEEDGAAVVARWKAVGGREANAHAWAGDYFSGGSTHGTFMRWSPGGGFVIAHVNKCAAQAVAVVYGRAEVTPTVVKFVPEFSKGTHGHGQHARPAAPPPAEMRFVPVEWRGERLLVPEERMGDFGDYIAGLGQYNDYDIYIFLDYTAFLTQFGGRETGEGDGARPAAERRARPSVPPGYEKFLKRPIRATVVGVGRTRDVRDYTDKGLRGEATHGLARLTFVTLNVGREHGVGERMAFRFAGPEQGSTVRVVRAGARTSTALVIGGLDPDEKARRPPLRPLAGVGDRVTTSPF
jgi:hypothetical protein